MKDFFKLILLFSILSAVAGCSDYTGASGYVYDDLTRLPVRDVSVTLSNEPNSGDECYTDENGYFFVSVPTSSIEYINFAGSGPWIHVEKEGYYTYHDHAMWNEHVDLTVYLKKE